MMKKKSAAAAGIVAVSAALCLNGASGFRSRAVNHKNEAEPEPKEPQTSEKRQAETIGQLSASGKDETVYVTAGADGSVKQVIVSEWLKNNGENITLDDMTNLLHIENVKGTESFSENSDGSVTWAAGGNDIYYQGESEEELPVSMKITYTLDGKKISPEDLAGKSGRVTMRFDYENHTFEEMEIDGKTEEICTPFLMLTGMVLPGDTFRNVEVKNGRVLSDGNNQVVVGTAFPGLSESLKLSEIEDLEEKEIPDYVEVTADVEDFSLMMTATVATTGTLSKLDLGEELDLDEMKNKLDELTDASTRLVDGSGELSDGVQTLWDAIVEYTDGMNSADEGTGELLDGINTLNEKKVDLVDGVTELREGMETLDEGTSDLKDGVDKYTDGVGTLAKGASDLDSGAGQVKAGIDTLNEKKGDLVDGVSALAAGSRSLKAGADNLQNGIQSYTAGVQDMTNGIGGVKAGVDSMLEKLTAAGGTQTFSGSGALDGSVEAVVNVDLNAVSGTASNAVSDAASDMVSNTASLEDSLAEIRSGVEAAQNSLTELQVSSCGNSAGYSTNIEEVKAQMQKEIGALGLDEDVTARLNGLIDGLDIQVTAEEQGSDAPDLTALAENLNQIRGAADGAGAAAAGLQSAGQSQAEASRSQTAVVQAQKEVIQAQTDAIQAQQKAMADLAAGLQQISGGLQQLQEGGNALCQNNQALVEGAAGLAQGAGQVSAGTGTLAQGAGVLSAGIQQLADGATSLKDGTSKLNAGAAELDSNSGDLREGTRKLKDGSVELLDGGRKLEDGAGELSDGVQELADGALELKDGTTELNDAGVDLKDGVLELKDGSDELRDGMKEFDEEGIHKLTDKAEDDLLAVLDRLKAAADADKSYTSFGGRMEGVEGSVKFIIETEGIGR